MPPQRAATFRVPRHVVEERFDPTENQKWPILAKTSRSVLSSCIGNIMTRAYVDRFLAHKHVRVDIPIDHFLGGRPHIAKPHITILRPVS